jgi:hypothetical protein
VRAKRGKHLRHEDHEPVRIECRTLHTLVEVLLRVSAWGSGIEASSSQPWDQLLLRAYAIEGFLAPEFLQHALWGWCMINKE